MKRKVVDVPIMESELELSSLWFPLFLMDCSFWVNVNCSVSVASQVSVMSWWGWTEGGHRLPVSPMSACWQEGHGPFWPLALAPLRWLTSFLQNRVRAQIIPAYSAALPVSSSIYTPIKSTHTHTHTHTLYFRYIFMSTNLEITPYTLCILMQTMFRAELTFIRCTWQDSYHMYRFLVCFLINQLYQSCAMHHKSLIVLMQTILQDLSHLSPSVATMCVRGEHDASSCLGSYESFIGFHHPRRENALNVFAIIPLITALCTWAKPTIRNCKLVSQ